MVILYYANDNKELPFLNLPLWANFYIYTDLSGTTTSTIPLDQLTNWMTSTLNQASPAAQVEAG